MRLAAWLVCALAAPLSWSVAAQDLRLTDVRYAALPGDEVQITLELSGPAPAPNSFTIDNPARIALDLPDTQNALAERTQNINLGVARSLSVAQAQGRTRVVLNLDRLVPFETRTEGNLITVVLDPATAGGAPARAAASDAQRTPAPSTAAASAADAAGTASAAPRANAAADGGEREVRDIDFRRAEAGAGRVIVTLSDGRAPIDMRQEGTQVIVDFFDTDVDPGLAKRLDVSDFATPVRLIDTYRLNDRVRMEITPLGEFEPVAYQTNNVYTVEIKPVTVEEKEREEKERFGYTGEKLSLNFQNIEVRAVLQLIADFTGLNLVTSDSVTGNITLRLQNVPWDQALDIILKTKGLGMRQAGNVILVAPNEELAAREKLELEAQKQIEELAPLRSEFIQINYAKAADLATLIKAKENSLLSPRGSVTIDERTNTLLVQDTAETLNNVRRLVQTLDIPVRQVLIESRIVIANDDFNRELGVRFGATGVRKRDGGVVTTAGGASGTDGIVNDAVDNIGQTGQPFPVGIPSLGGPNDLGQAIGDRLNVLLPTTGTPHGRIAFALLGSNYLIDLELSALQAEGRGELISSPRVITANQREALIEQGVEIPYQEASASGATSVSFKKAVLALRVTPQITPDDRIIMDLTVNRDSVGDIFNGVPSIDTREVSTQVLVQNGETVVLGGIYEQERRDNIDRVPFFGELPAVGALFRRTNRVDNKAELLVFVTPKIVKETLRLR